MQTISDVDYKIDAQLILSALRVPVESWWNRIKKLEICAKYEQGFLLIICIFWADF